MPVLSYLLAASLKLIGCEFLKGTILSSVKC